MRSVQKDQRVLTTRSDIDIKLDEATRVFNVCEADIDEKLKLVFTDLGGHEVYHLAYQVNAKVQSVPLLVVDIAEFDSLVHAHGVEAAAQDVCFQWIAHLYTSQPNLGRPVLVLTHGDLLSNETLKLRKKQLLSATEKLRLDVIQSEEGVAMPDSSFFSMTCFIDRAQPLITTILELSASSSKMDIKSLKSALKEAGAKLITDIPGSWYEVLNKLTAEEQKPYVSVTDFIQGFSKHSEHALQYVKEAGRIMWFQDVEKLSDYLFHRPSVLADVIRTLYDHADAQAWEHRITKFRPYRYKERPVDRREYVSMVNDFKATGIIRAALLHNLLSNESELPVDVGITLLKTFHLICGPIESDGSEKFIVPYFSTKNIPNPTEGTNHLQLRVDLYLNGLNVPQYVYHVITARFLDICVNPFNTPEAGINGASVQEMNGVLRYLLHNEKEKQVTLITQTPARLISNAWKTQLETMKRLTSELDSVWKGVRYDHVFYCSHCLLTKQSSPATFVNPEWFNRRVRYKLPEPRHTTYTGEETCPCDTNDGRRCVPLPLRYPCKFMEKYHYLPQQIRLIHLLPFVASIFGIAC